MLNMRTFNVWVQNDTINFKSGFYSLEVILRTGDNRFKVPVASLNQEPFVTCLSKIGMDKR